MKTILTLAFALFSFAAAPSVTQACDTYRTVSYCVPTLVCTREICRSIQCRYATDHCGRRYSYEVTVVTYANIYSDGSSQQYTRSFRS